MTVILTGDVHQAMGSSDQRYANCSEVALASEYAWIAGRRGVKVTLFITGRAAIEDKAAVKVLSMRDNVEIGGHGWDALRPRLWHGMLSRLVGSPHGPRWLQRRMIRRTCAVIERYTGCPVRSWRNHAYRHDQHTPYLLVEAGITTWSDETRFDRYGPRPHRSGVAILPINTMPDHENMYHGTRTPMSVAAEGHGFSYWPHSWCTLVQTQVERIEDVGGVAVILAHPICMKVSNQLYGFEVFERLCAFLSRYRTAFATDVTERLQDC